MPKSSSALQLVRESRMDFLQRRVSCAYRAVMDSNGSSDPSSVFRAAHMHKPDNWLELFDRAKSDYMATDG
ncbi:hypothetical protein D9M68_998750 [compost metagenome]